MHSNERTRLSEAQAQGMLQSPSGDGRSHLSTALHWMAHEALHTASKVIKGSLQLPHGFMHSSCVTALQPVQQAFWGEQGSVATMSTGATSIWQLARLRNCRAHFASLAPSNLTVAWHHHITGREMLAPPCCLQWLR